MSKNREVATEIKFVVPAACVDSVREWARACLNPDPHGGGPRGDLYRTTSLYFDTTQFDVFHRRGSFGRSKYRIRRYGHADQVFLERKLKTGYCVSKRRSIVALSELHRIGGPEPESGWAGYWFHRRLLARDLKLVCQVSYARTALVSSNGMGPIRFTLDENLRATAAAEAAFRSPASGMALSPRQAILEMKYHRDLPPVFEDLIARFSLI